MSKKFSKKYFQSIPISEIPIVELEPNIKTPFWMYDLYKRQNDIKIAKEAFDKLNQDIKIAIDKACEALRNCSNSLNKLKKQNPMKITDETRIKDLIPKGYELDDKTEYSAKNAHDLLERYVIIPFKKKEVKDFKWYVGEYMNAAYFNLKYKVHGNVCDNFRLENFDKVPFEFKIGLLKFICDDIKCDWKLFIDIRESKPEFTKICAICPAEFLNSILK